MDEGGAPREVGSGNARVGFYVSQLGLSEQAIVYITRSAPDQMQWLTVEDAILLGISVQQLGRDDPSAGARPKPAPSADDGGLPAPTATPAAVPSTDPPVTGGDVVAQAVLYEEGAALGSQAGSAVRGSVLWSMETEVPGGAAHGSVVKAVVRIDGRDLTATITIRENTDSGLPASLMIEIQLATPDGFEGGGIRNVPGVIMKETEEARGDALRGAEARVSSGLFWIVLSHVGADEQKNLELLRTRDWIDIPILYENGRRAILTLCIGAESRRSVDAAIESWKNG